MAHTFLALDTSLIPQSTKDNVPTYLAGYFSNEGGRLLIDGYNENRELVHPQATFDAWLQWSDNPEEIQAAILEGAIEYTKEEFQAETSHSDSIWFNA